MTDYRKTKLLIIRFSSFGDVIQTLGTISLFKEKFPESEVHWVIRSDLKDLIRFHPHVDKIWSVTRHDGFLGLLKVCFGLFKQGYTHVYDAHNNLRSHILFFFLWPLYFIRRQKNRIKRILLFQFRINLFGKKFIQQESFLKPLEEWGIPFKIPNESQLYIDPNAIQKVKNLIAFKKFIAIVPSSAWDLKKWPLEHWYKLLDQNRNYNFVVLGGMEDAFIQDIIPKNSPHVLDLSGKLSIIESCAVVSLSQLTIGNDTGLSHAADQMKIPLIQFIGPVLFGYPARPSSTVLEIDLKCRPCTKDGRGACRIADTKKCLKDITPELVSDKIRELLK